MNNKPNFSYFIDALLRESSKHIDVAEPIIISTALSFMSSVIGSRVYTMDGATNKLGLNVWTLIVAPSTISSKSTTIKFLRKIIIEKVEKKLLEMTIEAKSKTQTKETKIASNRFVLGAGSSFQGMIKFLENSNHGALLLIDEASEFLTKLNKNQETKASITALYDCEPYSKDIVGVHGMGESIVILNPFLSIIAATNEEWFRSDVKISDFLSGFLNRFNIIKIPLESLTPLQAFHYDYSLDPSIFQNISLEVLNQLDVDFKSFHTFDPKECCISDDAKNAYKSWFNMKSVEMLENAKLCSGQGLSASVMRQATSAIKYAVICQIYDCAFKQKKFDFILNKTYMEIGIKLAEYFINSLNNTFNEETLQNTSNSFKMGSFKNFHEQLAEKVHTYLAKSHEPKTKSDLTNAIRGLTASNFEQVMVCAQYVEVKKNKKCNEYSIIDEKRSLFVPISIWDDETIS